MQYHKSVLPKYLCTLLAFLLVLSFALFGCGKPDNTTADEPNSPTEPDPISDRYLRIRLTADPQSYWYSEFTAAELGGNFSEGLNYKNVKDVTIEIDGQNWKLEEALRDGAITEEDIFYYARKDAAAGICQEITESTHSLTNFFYIYPEYDLHLVYDILEIPGGEQRLISVLTISAPDVARYNYYNFMDQETQTMYITEDWGLSYQITDVSPTGLKLVLTQSKGQQIGQLHINEYFLQIKGARVDRIDIAEYSELQCDYTINMDGTTEITIDWTEAYGELPSGYYHFLFRVEDIYDESQLHPLMDNYYDVDWFGAGFPIPE